MFSTIIWDPDIILFKLGFLTVRWYSVCWILAFLSSYIVLRRIFKKEGISEEKLLSLAIYVFIGTFVGARLAHCLFYDPQYFLAHPLEIILPFHRDPITHKLIFAGYAGLASHGGAVGIIVALLLFARKYKIPFLDLSDKLGLVAPLAGAFIRIGNFINSEIIGKATDLPWGVVFSRVDSVPRHPSQLYEAIAYIAVFILVYFLYTRKRGTYKPGFILGVSLTGIFAARFLLEYTKEVQSAFEIGMRQAVGMDMGQLLSLPFIVAGIILIVKKRKLSPVTSNSTKKSVRSRN